MFQYAAVLGASIITGHDPCAPISASDLARGFILGSVLDESVPPPVESFREPRFSFSREVFGLSERRDFDLLGYYQSPKYFAHCEEIVRSNFTFTDEVRERAEEVLAGVRTSRVSVHVRRGDYTDKSRIHSNLPLSWYRQALARFEGHSPIVFSDDPDWCRRHFDSQVVVSGNDAHVDMCAMALCHAHVIANSTYSWWAAWLGGGPTVAPRTWFKPAGPRNWQDLYCEGWEIL